jgi:lipopolysaccharide transport system permease protein
MYPIDLMKNKLINVQEGTDYSWIIDYNPMAHIIEISRDMILNEGTISKFGIIYTVSFTFIILIFGVLIFNKTEKSFIDTI